MKQLILVTTLLQNKTLDFKPQTAEIDHSKYEILFQDKSMTISYFEGKIYWTTRFAGQVKDSFLTINKEKGKFTNPLHAVAEERHIQTWKRGLPQPTMPDKEVFKIKIGVSKEEFATIENPTSRLVQLCQAKFKQSPEFIEDGDDGGPDHNKTFYEKVLLPNGIEFKGEGTSKKLAKADAASNALKNWEKVV